jgi:SlyX protein
MEERLTELEIKISFMEDQVDALNTLLYRQQQQMDLMIGELRRLRDQVSLAQPTETRNLRDEIPPHY